MEPTPFSERYQKIKPGVVAIVAALSKNGDFPDILGTGFIAREDGLIITNNHVVQLIRQLPRRKGAPEDEWPIKVLYLENIPGKGMASAYLEVEGVGTLEREKPIDGHYYGPEIPDVGFIFVKVRGLPFLEVEETIEIKEGDEIYVAGFPMGTRTLRAPGWIHQINPVLQRGILSAMQPFPCDKPHGYLIDVVAQGGSSGSPIFNPKTGKIAALLYGGIPERNTIRLPGGSGLPYTYGTSLTLAIPSPIISALLKMDMHDRKTNEVDQRDASKYPTLAEFFELHEMKIRTPRSSEPATAKLSPSGSNQE